MAEVRWVKVFFNFRAKAFLSRSRDRLAEALCRSANSTKEKQIWAPMVEWLKRNRYDRMANEIMISKTLVGDRRKK